jgi:hypothetical protein
LALVLAAAALGRAAEKSELLRALVFGDSDWEDEEVDSLRAALDLLGPVREHLSRANSLPSSSYGADYSEVLTATARDVPSLLSLQRVLLVEAAWRLDGATANPCWLRRDRAPGSLPHFTRRVFSSPCS